MKTLCSDLMTGLLNKPVRLNEVSLEKNYFCLVEKYPIEERNNKGSNDRKAKTIVNDWFVLEMQSFCE